MEVGDISRPASIISYALFTTPPFQKLGITVPKNHTFTDAQSVDVVKKSRQGGRHAGAAIWSGNRNYPALFPIWGSHDHLGLVRQKNAHDIARSPAYPETRQVLDWMVQLRDAGMWPKTFATMTIYGASTCSFHTQDKPAMLHVLKLYPGVDQSRKRMAASLRTSTSRRRATREMSQEPDDSWTAGRFSATILSSTRSDREDILAFMASPQQRRPVDRGTEYPQLPEHDVYQYWPDTRRLQEMCSGTGW